MAVDLGKQKESGGAISPVARGKGMEPMAPANSRERGRFRGKGKKSARSKARVGSRLGLLFT